MNKALKTIRLYHSLTQAELASELSISKSYLSEIESGKKSISLDLLNQYSLIFDIPVSSLVFFSESSDSNNTIPDKFRTVFSKKIIKMMEWVIEKNKEKIS